MDTDGDCVVHTEGGATRDVAGWKGEIAMVNAILLGIAIAVFFVALPTGVVMAWLMREDASDEELDRTWKRVFWAGAALASVFFVVVTRMA